MTEGRRMRVIVISYFPGLSEALVLETISRGPQDCGPRRGEDRFFDTTFMVYERDRGYSRSQTALPVVDTLEYLFCVFCVTSSNFQRNSQSHSLFRRVQGYKRSVRFLCSGSLHISYTTSWMSLIALDLGFLSVDRSYCGRGLRVLNHWSKHTFRFLHVLQEYRISNCPNFLCLTGGKVNYQQPALERCDNLGRVEEVLPPADSVSALAEVAVTGCWPRGARGGSWFLAFEEASGLRCCIEATRH